MAACPICQNPGIEPLYSVFDRLQRRAEKVWSIVRCTSCGFGWTSPTLAEEEIAGYYPAGYLGDTARTLAEFCNGRLAESRSWRQETEKVQLVEQYSSGGRILDVGCGDGKFLWALDASKWERTGAELSREVVELVRRKIPALSLVHGDIFWDGFEHASFDVITFWHVLEHLPDPRRVVSRASDLLCPGGWLFVSLPNLDSLQALIFRRYWYGFDDVPRHLYHFSKRALDLVLVGSGLNVKDHLLFSRLVNFHSLKHSLLNWSEERFKTRVPYYALKPLLFGVPLLEQLTGRYGMLTTIARKPPEAATFPKQSRAALQAREPGYPG